MRKTPLSLEAVVDYLIKHENTLRGSPIHINQQTRDTYFISYEASLEMRYFEINITFNPIDYAASLLIVVRETTQNYQISLLKDQDKMRSLALASISHEFRTPLNGSLTMLQLAVKNADVPAAVVKELLTPAVGSMKMLLSLVNDILDYSQINENKFKLCFVETNLRQTISETVSVVDMLATRKGINIICSFPENLPPFFTTDPNRLTQILLNLLSNSVKFTIEGEVSIILKLDDSNHNLIHFSVQDTGIGMKSENLERLFSNYTKIDLGENQHLNSAGCGLGLSIANKLAMALGRGETDHMKVESKYGEGSKFMFTIENKARDITLGSDAGLSKIKHHQQQSEDRNMSFQDISFRSQMPKESDLLVDEVLNNDSFRYTKGIYELSTDREKQNILYKFDPHTKSEIHDRSLQSPKVDVSKVEEKSPLEPEADTAPSVFVVDDDLFNVHSLQMLLSTYGIKATPAYDGSQVLPKINKLLKSRTTGSYDTTNSRNGLDQKRVVMVFMDTNMPIMNGFEATEKIKKIADQAQREVIVVGVSGYVDQEHQNKMIKAGADYVLTKPIQKSELEKILKKHILRT